MPTQWKRISVIEDRSLSEALDIVAPFYPEVAPATLVHDLAIRGAHAVVEENKKAADQIEALIAFSTERQGLIDWQVLEQVDDLAWGD